MGSLDCGYLMCEYGGERNYSERHKKSAFLLGHDCPTIVAGVATESAVAFIISSLKYRWKFARDHQKF